MTQRPYVLLSVAMSVDGCIDDATGDRLILSNEADLDRVDEVRAGSDAILVGAGTIRRDNPALLVRSKFRRNRRIAGGLPPSPARVTLTVSGDLDASARFFTAGEGARLVYVPAGERDRVTGRIGGGASRVARRSQSEPQCAANAHGAESVPLRRAISSSVGSRTSSTERSTERSATRPPSTRSSAPRVRSRANHVPICAGRRDRHSA